MDNAALIDMDVSALAEDDLVAAITELAAHMNAAEHRLIALIGEWDARDMPSTGGTCTLVQWLGWQCGIDAGAAREKVRVARALRALPLVSACFQRGEVSYSKVSAITRVATTGNEHLLLGFAQAATAAQTETIVRGYRRMQRLDDPQAALRQHQARGLHWHFDDDGMLLLQGRFPPAEGALILKAIEAVQEELYREAQASAEGATQAEPDTDTDTDAEHPANAHRADAFVRLVEHGISSKTSNSTWVSAERHLVVLHVAADGHHAELEAGPVLAATTARRVTCDASVVVSAEDPRGNPVSIGRRSRTVPWWLRRSLQHRDGGCRFPGCNHQRHVDAHHIKHWADGGETAMDNLVLLCRHHHRLVHEYGYRCCSQADGRISFQAPDGNILANAMPQQPGACGALVQQHAGAGLHIDQHSCAGGWDGGPADLGEAVAQLWALDQAQLQPSSEGRFRGNAPA